MKTVAFIGLGHMGNPMVKNLLKAGFTVQVYDVSPAARQAIVTLGAKDSASVSAAIQQADVVISMVQTGEQVSEICLGEQGIFSQFAANVLLIDCSSIDIAMTQKLHQEAEKHAIAMLDAPVSGGVAGAEAATLTFMVGGTEANFQRALPVLNVMGKKIVHAGAAGHGQAAKICNNLLLGISMIGVSEAFTLADKLGLDAKKFFEISSNASGQCWSMTSYCPVPGILENVPSSHAYQAGFMAKMMLKDLNLAKSAAETAKAYIPMGSEAINLYQAYISQGNGELDFSGIINFIRENKR